ncbi:MAG: hypothetical protein AB1782_07430 [Cyanobacteriota bacterium]
MSSFLSRFTELVNPSRFSGIQNVQPVDAKPIQTTAKISGNPFLTKEDDNKEIYGKNRPVPGGYFAGYINGKPNIVGSKLFIII